MSSTPIIIGSERSEAGLPDSFKSELRAPCLIPDGRHDGAAGQHGSTYGVMTTHIADVQFFPRVHV